VTGLKSLNARTRPSFLARPPSCASVSKPALFLTPKQAKLWLFYSGGNISVNFALQSGDFTRPRGDPRANLRLIAAHSQPRNHRKLTNIN
jgi:hypothetical protein